MDHGGRWEHSTMFPLSLSPSLSLLNFFLILLSPRWGYNVVFMEVRVLIEAIRNSGFNERPTQNPRGNYVIFPTFLLTFFFLKKITVKLVLPWARFHEIS
jgi:hypothetical protein